MKTAGAGVPEVDHVATAGARFAETNREALAMAYLRGNTYVWSDGRREHIWVSDGDDGWAESGWADGVSSGASGVSIDREAIDEYVMMRFAELIRDRTAWAAAERAMIAHHGNGGCVALEEAWSDLSVHVAALQDKG